MTAFRRLAWAFTVSAAILALLLCLLTAIARDAAIACACGAATLALIALAGFLDPDGDHAYQRTRRRLERDDTRRAERTAWQADVIRARQRAHQDWAATCHAADIEPDAGGDWQEWEQQFASEGETAT